MQRVFPWAHQSPWRKRHLDRSSRFLQGSLADRPTDRPRYSVGINRRRAQWRSYIHFGWHRVVVVSADSMPPSASPVASGWDCHIGSSWLAVWSATAFDLSRLICRLLMVGQTANWRLRCEDSSTLSRWFYPSWQARAHPHHPPVADRGSGEKTAVCMPLTHGGRP